MYYAKDSGFLSPYYLSVIRNTLTQLLQAHRLALESQTYHEKCVMLGLYIGLLVLVYVVHK